MSASLRVTVWNEYRHESPAQWATVRSILLDLGFSEEKIIQAAEGVHRIYPEDIHTALARHLRMQGYIVRKATLDEPEHGLTAAVLAETDVLIWWTAPTNGPELLFGDSAPLEKLD